MTLYEKESIITYNEGEATADIYTYDPKLIIKLERLSKKYPDKIIHERNEPEGGVSYTVPKECIVVREPYSDTIRQAARERAIQGGFKPPNRDSGPK